MVRAGRVSSLVSALGCITLVFLSRAQAFEFPPSSFDGPRKTILPLPAVAGGQRVLAGRFDSDEFDDLVVLSQAENSEAAEITLYRGYCDGSFSAAFGHPVLPGFLNVQSGDFDRDGRLDLVLTGFKYDSPWIGWAQLFLTRDNGFETGFEKRTAGVTYNDVAVADFDRDGFLDFAAAVSNSVPTLPRGLTIFRGTGTGRNFILQPTVTESASVLATGDFNRDGWTDIVLGGTGLWLALNDGTGSMLSAQAIVRELFRYELLEIWPEDHDGDGLLDLLVAGADYNYDSTGGDWSLDWYRREQDGSFGLARLAGDLFEYFPPVVSLLDLNQDGQRDLVIGGGQDRGVIWPRQASGVFGYPIAVRDLDHSTDFASIRSAADGVSQLVILNRWDLTVAFLDSSGVPQMAPVLELGGHAEFHDYDGDGFDDLRAGTLVYPRSRDGGFDNPREIRLDQYQIEPWGRWPGPLSWGADLNGDGWQDFVQLGQGDLCGFFHFCRTNVWLGTAAFTYRLSQNLPTHGLDRLRTMANPSDIDGDGDRDLVLADYGELMVLLNDGTGYFTVFSVIEVPLADFVLALHDLNGDDFDDLIYSYASAPLERVLGVLLNNGSGSFVGHQEIVEDGEALVGAPAFLQAGAGPGQLEVALSDPGAHAVRVYHTKPTGLLELGTVLPGLTGQHGRLLALDLDGDDLTDLVDGGSSPTYWRNLGPGSFSAAQRFHLSRYEQDADWLPPRGTVSAPTLVVADSFDFGYHVAWSVPQGGSSLEPEVLLEASSPSVGPGDRLRIRARIRGARAAASSNVYLAAISPDGSVYSYSGENWTLDLVPLSDGLSLGACSSPVTLLDVEAIVGGFSAEGSYALVLAAFDSVTGQYQDSMRLGLDLAAASP